MTTRGIPESAVERYRLGVVDDHPLEYMVGRLSIPYQTLTGIIAIKYRCLRDHDCKEEKCPKFLYDDGGQPLLYNAGATLTNSPLIFVTEGEPDTWAVETITGFPAVAVPGAQTWQINRYWARCFSPFPLVVLPADGDRAGRDLAKEMMGDLAQLRVVHMPTGMDANDVLRTEGREAFLRRCDLEDYL